MVNVSLHAPLILLGLYFPHLPSRRLVHGVSILSRVPTSRLREKISLLRVRAGGHRHPDTTQQGNNLKTRREGHNRWNVSYAWIKGYVDG